MEDQGNLPNLVDLKPKTSREKLGKSPSALVGFIHLISTSTLKYKNALQL